MKRPWPILIPLVLLLATAAGCSTAELTEGDVCASCPGRCVSDTNGETKYCADCLEDSHCGGTRKCVKLPAEKRRKCVCGTDKDCPDNAHCGVDGCKRCYLDQHCPKGKICASDHDCYDCSPGDSSSCPDGVATRCQGTRKCRANGTWGACEGYVAKSGPEVCDGKDNDCDGRVDEEFPEKGKACSLPGGQGACAKGVYADCVRGKLSCQSPGSGPEVCNGKDDDCDGVVDNVSYSPASCKISGKLGVCALGTWRCVSQQKSCVESRAAGKETCNGEDDDCDGLVDEGLNRKCYGGAPGTAGVGVCKEGVQQCLGGTMGNCVGALLPGTETCNGKDDDCDGQTDEGSLCPPGTRCIGGVCKKAEQGQAGCADGSRELFTDRVKWPRVAGCAGWWRGESLRKAKTGQSCGADENNACQAAANLCASGWHICMKNGDPSDLSSRVSDTDCASAGPGMFVAAASHCGQSKPACTYPKPLPCTTGGLCSEPICCGQGCGFGICKSGAFGADKTRCARPHSFVGCGNCNSFHGSPRLSGVLCCKD